MKICDQYYPVNPEETKKARDEMTITLVSHASLDPVYFTYSTRTPKRNIKEENRVNLIKPKKFDIRRLKIERQVQK